jgi:hypothetical protein
MAAGNGGASGRGGNGDELSLRGWAAEAEAAATIAKALAPTDFVPDQLRRWTNPQERDPAKKVLDYDGTVQTIAAVLLAGQELGFKPMASLRAFTIIRGTVAMYAIAARGLLQNHGHEIIVVESTTERAVVRARRDGTDTWQQSMWDLPRARLAKLYPGHPDGNWSRQPKAMLIARATAEAARWVASDALLGLPYFAEEIEDGVYEITTAPAAIEAPPATGDGQAPASGVAAGSRTRKKSPARAALPVAPPSTVPEPPQSAEPVAPVPGEPAEALKPTRAMMNKLHAGLRDLQITDREAALPLLGAWLEPPRKLGSTTELSRDEMGLVLTRIDSLLSIAAAAGPPDEETPEPPDEAAIEESPP